ncbi:MAG TPA: PstS family phosphate ABC transporter substrate-binding protein [Chryseosolibacter sp.]|nr:PstS family phosphate ABC transporter substrate-binding protein [Chryseosolibacter sp.]
MKSNFQLIWAAGAMMVILSACGSKDNSAETANDATKLKGEIKIDGSSTVYPITEAVAEEFRNEQPDVKITVGLSGTGGGFKKFGRGEIDINDASRPIKPQEDSICKQNNVGFVELKVAFDGLAIVVSKENTWLNEITIEELKKIWEPAAQRKVTKWNQVNPKWPNEEFRLYGAGVASGTYDYFTEAVVGKSGASRGDYTASEDDNVLVQGVSGDKNGLAFFGLAYYEENKERLKLVPVNNGSGAVLPTAETVKNGTYAPLSRPVFIYVTEAAARRKDVNAFVNFYLQTAAELVPDVGYIALPQEEYRAQLAKFQDFAGAKQ